MSTGLEEPKTEKSDETKPSRKKVKVDTKPEEKPIGGAFKGKKVLIVEDTIELAEVIQATIERMGITAYHETHGAKAFDLFKENKPDLVLLDIGLPDMIGWKLLDSIKAMTNEVRPLVVVITAYGDPANRLMGKLQDVDSYLIKPFSPDEVEQVVSRVFSEAE